MLQSKIRAEGTVRVIVGLSSPAEPMAAMAASRDLARDGLRRGAIRRLRQRALAGLRFASNKRIRQFRQLPFLALEVDEAELARLEASGDVVSIREDEIFELTLGSSVPMVGATDVFAEGFRGAGQTVAILDTGVESGHTFFSGRVVAGACFSTTSAAAGSTQLCPAGLDPDMDGHFEQIGISAGAPCPQGSCWHGTHVAGIAAGDDGAGLTGVAPDANIIAIQVFSAFGSAIAAFESDIIAALDHVYTLRNTYDIASVNMSLGGSSYSRTVSCDSARPGSLAAILNLRSVGIATVISSGNESETDRIGAPGCLSAAIGVGSTTDSDNVAASSNSASWLSLLAPGTGIYSSKLNGTFGNAGGTSMAAPHVAGSFALLRSKTPDASVDEILASLQNFGLLVTDTKNGLEHPRIEVGIGSMAFAPGLPRPVNIIMDSDYGGATQTGLFSVFNDVTSYGGRASVGIDPGVDRYRFTPALPVAGLYRIHVWWPMDAANSDTVWMDISHDGGITSVAVNQKLNGGQWNPILQDFSLSNGTAYVEVSDAGGTGAVVDAVRFELVDLSLTPIPAAPSMLTTALPDATVGVAYSVQIAAADGVLPYDFSVTGGALPAGLSLDAATGEIFGTPSAAGAPVFTVMVEDQLFAGDSMALSIDVAPGSGGAIGDDFDDGDLVGWTVGDDTTSGAPAWSASGGELLHTTNAWQKGVERLGTYLSYDDGFGWDNYVLSFDMRSDDDDIVGAMFRYTDGNNYYRFLWDKQRNERRLDKRVGGAFTTLFSEAVPFMEGQTYAVEVSLQDTLIEVRIDGAVVVSLTDSSHSGGTAAMYVWANDGAHFDNFLVTPSGGGNQAPVITSVTATPSTLDELTTSALSVSATDGDGPSSLSYLWSVAAGDGSFDDATSSSPVYTAPAVVTSRVITISVDVSDGLASTPGSVDVTVNDIPSVLPEVTTSSLPDATEGVFYSATMMASGGVPPYDWSITTGALPAGLGLNATSGEISGTPTSSGNVAFTATVTDNVLATDDASLSIQVHAAPSTLLDENFDDGDFAGWTVGDDTTSGAPSWLVSGGALVHTTNAWKKGVERLGTYLSYDGGFGWDNYVLSFDMSSADDDIVGVMFRYSDENNYYRFLWDKQRNERRLDKRVGGAFTTLFSEAVPFVQGQTYAVEVSVDGTLLEVSVDGGLVVSLTDSSHVAGTAAMYVWANDGASFDNVSVSPSGSPPSGTSFSERCNGSGVIFCDPLDTEGPWGVDGSGQRRLMPNPDGTEGIPTQAWWRKWRGVDQQHGNTLAGLDATVKASGTGSLKFEYPGFSGPAGAGEFTTNFSDDLSQQFGEGDAFYLQYRYRVNCDFLYFDCDPSSPTYKTERRYLRSITGGSTIFKHAIIAGGDQVLGAPSSNPCDALQIVLDHGPDHYLAGYHACGWYIGFQEATGERFFGSNQKDYQPNVNASPQCWWIPDPTQDQRRDWGYTGPDCWYLESEEWMTIQMRLDIGPRQPDRTGPPLSHVTIWAAHEGEPQQVVIDHDFYIRGTDDPNYKYGKVYLLPYTTDKDATEDHPMGEIWYDELIVSTEFIASPE